MVMFLLTAFVFGFGMASTILIGQAWGRKDVDGARRVFGTAAARSAVTIAIAIAGWICRRRSSPARHAGRRGAARARLSARDLPRHAGAAAADLLMMALRGAGDSLTPLWFMIVAVVLDSGLNPVFILGLGPAPRWASPARRRRPDRQLHRADRPLASTCTPRPAAAAARARASLPAARPRDPEDDRRQGPADGHPDDRHLHASALALVGLVNREGVDTTAAFGVAMQLWTYVQMPAMALGAAVSAMAAQNIGAGKWDRVARSPARASSTRC
jgi:hypothetical protein